MQAIKRFLEWYLGIPPADPGQGTAWNFGYRTPWPAWLPDWSVLLLAILLVAFVVYIYVRDAKTVSLRWRVLMISLRLAVIALLLAFLTELTLTVDRTGLPSVAVLIDDSASMALEDQYPDKADQNKARQLAAAGPSTGATRLNLAKALLTGDSGVFLKQLQRKHKVRVYRFAETAIPVGGGEYIRADEIEELIPLLNALEPTGDQTRPGPAVRKVLDDLRGTLPAAIIVLSDGIASTTDADRLSGAADFALSKLVPIYTVGIGSEDPARDLHLYDLLVDEVAFVDDPITFSAKLKGYGFAGKTAAVTLREANSNEVFAAEQVRVGADGEPVKVELTYTPPTAGEFDYIVEAAPLPRETNKSNNSETRHVSVREEKIRVLLADSVPRYEFRYLKHLLERDRTVELHTVLQDADLEYGAEDKTVLDHFPVRREELFQYDVVIFGDLRPDLLSSGVFENLREFVRESGGGLIMVAGPQYNPLAYRGTPLESLLPIQLADANAPSGEAPIVESFRPQLTLDGLKGSAVFRFTDSEQDSVAIWNKLPKLYWMVEAPALQPGAIVWAEHPTRYGQDGKLPVIVMQRFGAGKVLFHATDELWRWRFRVGDLYYGRYWVQATRYLSRSKLLGKDRAAELTVDRLVYQRGDTVSLRVRFLDDRLAPVEKDGVSVMVERRGDVQRPVKLSRLPQSPTVFEGQFTAAAEGSYHAWVVSPSFKDVPPSADFRVEAPLRELQRRSIDRTDLQQTAKTTRGKYYSLSQAAQLPAELPPGQPVALETQDPLPLWNRWEVLVLFAALLLGEWLLRKRWRLI